MFAVAVSGSTVYLGGYFARVGGQPRAGLAAVDVASGAVTDWNPGVTGYPGVGPDVRALAVNGQTVYAGGWFVRVGGQKREGLAAIDAVTGTATPWNPRTHGGVVTMQVSTDRIYIGGWFDRVAGRPRHNLAAVTYLGRARSKHSPLSL